jgi:hypothetical protein
MNPFLDSDSPSCITGWRGWDKWLVIQILFSAARLVLLHLSLWARRPPSAVFVMISQKMRSSPSAAIFLIGNAFVNTWHPPSRIQCVLFILHLRLPYLTDTTTAWLSCMSCCPDHWSRSPCPWVRRKCSACKAGHPWKTGPWYLAIFNQDWSTGWRAQQLTSQGRRD